MLLLISVLSLSFISPKPGLSFNATSPDQKPKPKIVKVEPCTVTVTDYKTFYVYNCGGDSYSQQFSASCTKIAATCSEAAGAAVNCVDEALNTAGGNWQNNIRAEHCPIDWIDPNP